VSDPSEESCVIDHYHSGECGRLSCLEGHTDALSDRKIQESFSVLQAKCVSYSLESTIISNYNTKCWHCYGTQI
jgi:hypothetical protein